MNDWYTPQYQKAERESYEAICGHYPGIVGDVVFACHMGWHPIIEAYLTEVQRLIFPSTRVRLVEVKEKFGGCGSTRAACPGKSMTASWRPVSGPRRLVPDPLRGTCRRRGARTGERGGCVMLMADMDAGERETIRSLNKWRVPHGTKLVELLPVLMRVSLDV